jgi:predicted  nucleic acid-binding Zn-ribbon protein
MSKKKQKERKLQKRKKNVEKKLLRRRTSMRAYKKLEKELEDLKRLQEEKLVPIRKSSNDS